MKTTTAEESAGIDEQVEAFIFGAGAAEEWRLLQGGDYPGLRAQRKTPKNDMDHRLISQQRPHTVSRSRRRLGAHLPSGVRAMIYS